MEKYFDLIKTFSLFEGINECDIIPLLSCLGAKTAHFEKNETIFSYSEDLLVGIVLSGKVHIIKEDYYGNRNIIANIEKGEIFGETISFANIKTLNVSAISAEKSDILCIDYRKVISPCSKTCHFHNRLIYNMVRILSLKNIYMNQKIEIISKRTTREKILAYLSQEADKAKSNTFKIPFNRQELADYLHVDRSAMSNVLCKLRDEGILNFNKNVFELKWKE